MLGPAKFEGLGMCFYEVVEYRTPLLGEFYLLLTSAYRATPSIHAEYYIVRPTYQAVPRMEYDPGAPVDTGEVK
jgi:hypothetical protein